MLVWAAAQLHLMFAAFVLAVPMFGLFIECMGWRLARRDPAAAARYDWLAHEMARLLPPAYSLTAISGAFLGFVLFAAYPRFMGYMSNIFGPTFVVYPLFFVAETVCLYVWYYAWDRLQGDRKWLHILLGVLLNVFGTIVMFIADAWATFMMTPAGGGLESGLDAAQRASSGRQYHFRSAAVRRIRGVPISARDDA
jgi:cytochrome bd-type quinol oxidase subunit 1